MSDKESKGEKNSSVSDQEQKKKLVTVILRISSSER